MQCVYYRDAYGREPVREFLNTLPVPAMAAVFWKLELLNALAPGDPPLAFPHSSQVEGEVRELRCHYGRDLYRVLYARSQNLFVLLHMFRKSSRTVPARDTQLALSRWADFQARMDAHQRQPPRAVGHDAP